MLCETVVKEIQELIEKYLNNQGYFNYEVIVQGQTKTGDNFVGEIIFVRVLSKNGDVIHDFAVKTAKRSDSLRKKFPVVSQYKRELFVYSEVFPVFRKFINKVNPKFYFDFVPKDYCICPDEKHETLVLENLVSAGYKMLDLKKPWNLEHSLMVMEKFGKFHAISFALNDQDPELFDHLTRTMTVLQLDYHNVVNMPVYVIEGILEYNMKVLRESGRNDLYDKFDLLHNEAYDAISYVVDIEDKRTICHGDCWNNNFMFKYQDEEDNRRPTAVKFLDFQVATFHSPVLDLSLNIYSTCDNDTLEHFDLLLETYYRSLSSGIESLGSDPSKLFTYKELRRHWRKYGLFGLILAHIALRLSHFTAEEAPDFIEISEGKKDFMECLRIQGKNDEQFNQRLLQVFSHFGDNFL